jgi:hypothetical protein
MSEDPGDIPLAKFIAALREELETAQRESDGSALRFGVGPIELDLELTTSREAGGEGGIKFYVITLGASGKRATGTTQRVKLQLTPKGEDNRPLEVAEDRLKTEPD